MENENHHPIMGYVWELEAKNRKLHRELLKDRSISTLLLLVLLTVGVVIGVLWSRIVIPWLG